jgi:hypothetical protein
MEFFKMITAEEKNIRTNLNARTSDVLKKVFALQDKKIKIAVQRNRKS